MIERSTPHATFVIIAGWVFSILASAMFSYAAYLKLTSDPITKQRLAGAAILCVVGLGAAFEHATHAQLGMAPIPLVLAAFAVIGALLRGTWAVRRA